MRKWGKYTVGKYSLGQLNGEAVATWREGRKRPRFRLGVFTEHEGRAALDGFARRQNAAEACLGTTVAALWEDYLADRKSDGKVVENMEFHWKALGPRFGIMTPSVVDNKICRDYADTRFKQGKSPGTVWTELTQLRTLFNWAVKNQKLAQAPPVWIPLKPDAKGRALTEDEALRLVDGCVMPHVRLFVILALTTAARTAAILELTWDRVDFKTGVVNLKVPRVVDWLQKKSQKRRAVIIMNSWLRSELFQAKQGARTDHIIEWDGEPVKCIRKGFLAAAERAGLGQRIPDAQDPGKTVFVSDVTPHTLRHTAATWMEEAGIPMSQISRFLGHKDESTTRTMYSHPRPAHLTAAAEVVNLQRVKERRSQVHGT